MPEDNYERAVRTHPKMAADADMIWSFMENIEYTDEEVRLLNALSLLDADDRGRFVLLTLLGHKFELPLLQGELE